VIFANGQDQIFEQIPRIYAYFHSSISKKRQCRSFRFSSLSGNRNPVLKNKAAKAPARSTLDLVQLIYNF